MLTEPQALDSCLWANRQVSDWVVVLHSFEEYLHSALFADGTRLDALLRSWSARLAPRRVALFELFQEPFGGPRAPSARSVLSSWTHKRGDLLKGKRGGEWLKAAGNHLKPFSFVADPLNVVHSAVHLAQPRGDGQGIVAMEDRVLRVNHYIDLGVNSSRCLHELGGCEVSDGSIAWAEDAVIARREKRAFMGTVAWPQPRTRTPSILPYCYSWQY
ncbi:unnamed protein product [Prorocentrum cordatum]|uniref:Phospholipase B-like n=1 Tax=Prorocentrum cordatum TaxID=2364126 RepID=A0ABN9UVD0_9DINO|nr:unnamed protein product [Polarella glacialis]